MLNTPTRKGKRPLTATKSVSRSILLVATSTSTAAELDAALQEAKYRVRSVPDSANIRQAIRKHKAAVVVMAVHTTSPDILDACSQVKRAESLGYVPVIIVAEQSDSPQWMAAIEAGADEFFPASIEPCVLIARVDALIAVQQRFSWLQRNNRKLADNVATRDAQLADARQATKSLDLLKTAIIRNVSHELRTPVLQVKASVALLKELYDQGDPNTRLINFAVESIGRLESVVSNVTQFVESQNLKIEPTVLNESIDLAIRYLERSWQSGNDHTRIKKMYSPDKTPLVMADKRGIAQALQLLLDNALKFSPEGGPVEVLIETQGDRVWVGVRDYGIGIPDDQMERIFESFYQVDSSTTRRFDGVGVGLTLARLIMDQMNASIAVESAPGKGSTFSFTLPKATIHGRNS
jgi:signal transduction histidine kinase